MGARIDKTLHLLQDGVMVTGTISNWDADQESAVFTTHIVQGAHVASGTSSRYPHGATKWQAYATGFLHKGSATGHASALIELSNGQTEVYKWTVPVTLV
jgi:hypothetical protein